MESEFNWQEQAVAYFDACNSAEAEAIAGCFSPQAVHYFPADAHGTPVTGASEIADRLIEAISRFGSVWTVDTVLLARDRPIAVVEWTNFRTRGGGYLRGDEWIVFDEESGLIDEIRPYYAIPPTGISERNELGGFDYSQRGYALAPPFVRAEGR